VTFHPGDRVRYVPGHAHGNISHADCENGVVTSIGRTGFVFVRFAGKQCSQACDAETLVLTCGDGGVVDGRDRTTGGSIGQP
jgi:hypothetical protein